MGWFFYACSATNVSGYYIISLVTGYKWEANDLDLYRLTSFKTLWAKNNPISFTIMNYTIKKHIAGSK